MEAIEGSIALIVERLMKELSVVEKAAIAAMAAGFDSAKKELADDTKAEVDVTIRVRGIVTKGRTAISSKANGAINTNIILAALIELNGLGALTDAIELSKSEEFSEKYTAGGGDAAVIADLSGLLGVPAKVNFEKAGSVSGKGLIVEVVETGAKQLAG